MQTTVEEIAVCHDHAEPSLGDQQERLFAELRALRDELGHTCSMVASCDLWEYDHLRPGHKIRTSWKVSLHLPAPNPQDGIMQGRGDTPEEAMAGLRRELRRREEKPTVYVEMTPEQAEQWREANKDA